MRRHGAGKEPVSDLAEELYIQPSQIHTWIEQVLDHSAQAFATTAKSAPRADDRKDCQIAALEAKLVKKNEGVAESMEEHVQLKKKSLGALKGV